jgi:hypothetical protein
MSMTDSNRRLVNVVGCLFFGAGWAYMFGWRTLDDLRTAELATAGFTAGVVHGQLLPVWSLLHRVGLVKYRRWDWIVTILLLPLVGAAGMLFTSNPAVPAFVVGSFTGFSLGSAVRACVSTGDMRGLAVRPDVAGPAREGADLPG